MDSPRSASKSQRSRKKLAWSTATGDTSPERRSGMLHSTPNKSNGSLVEVAASTGTRKHNSMPKRFESSLSSIGGDTVIPDDDLVEGEGEEGEEGRFGLSRQLQSLAVALHASRKGSEEMGLIYKQQNEMQLLMTELKDRDRELNDMVSAHKKQLGAWEIDRQKILLLEERFAKMKKELYAKDSLISFLDNQVKQYENLNQTRSDELETTQGELKEAQVKAGQSVREFQKLKAQQHSLQKSLKILKEREENISGALAAKTVELKETVQQLNSAEKRCQELGLQLQAKENAEAILKEELMIQKEMTAELKEEHKDVMGQNEEYQAEIDQLKRQLSTTREKSALLEKELQLSVEREKRKDQLLTFQKAKQQRCDSELSTSRQLYERQLREIEMLRLNLHSAQEEMVKQEQELSMHRHSPSKIKESSPGSSADLMQQKSPRRHELGQMASDIKIQLSNILNLDGENQGDSDSDEAASVASFSGFSTTETLALNTSGRLEKLLTESQQLAREISSAKTLKLKSVSAQDD